MTSFSSKGERRNRLGGGVAVEGKEVDGAGGDARESAGLSGVLDVLAESSGGALAVAAVEVGSETGNVGRGHRGTGDGGGAGGAADPGREDGGAGGEDVDDGAVVGEGRAGIRGGGGTDSAGRGGRGRGVVGSVGVVVTGGDGKEVAGVGDGSGGAVDGGGVATAEGHVDNDTVGAAAAGGIGDDAVHASNDTGGRAGARGGKDLDSIELGLLGNTIGRATNGAGNVGTVAVAISVVRVDVVGDPGSTAAELGVGGVDTSVNDVGAGAGTARVVVGVGGRASVPVGETGKTPGSTSLGDVGLGGEDGVLLDVLDLGVEAESLNGLVVELTGEALEGTLVALGGLATTDALANSAVDDGLGGGRLVLDDVLAGNDLASSGGLVERSTLLNRGGGGEGKSREEGDEGRQMHDCGC